jgi:hypothetical protein
MDTLASRVKRELDSGPRSPHVASPLAGIVALAVGGLLTATPAAHAAADGNSSVVHLGGGNAASPPGRNSPALATS